MAGALPHRCTVLIVDDDVETCDLLRMWLSASGYATAVAFDGREALHYLRSHAEVCAIILDLMLPNMDGAKFRSAQLRDRSLAWIPVIVVSGAVDLDERAHAFHARGVLAKPLDLDRVRETLARIGCCRARPRATPPAHRN
jgi:CheY-like chemotaxis protein